MSYSCSPPASPSTSKAWVGIMDDSLFLDFLKIDLPSLQTGDTLIQVEYLYEPQDKELYLIHKKKNQSQLLYRKYNIISNNNASQNTFSTENSLTGEVITWELLENKEKKIDIKSWNKIIYLLESSGTHQMPFFISDFVLGGRTTLISIYTQNGFNYVVRHSSNDTINKTINHFRTLK